jgi:ubiquinone biosynthesis monooxygenase Coq7
MEPAPTSAADNDLGSRILKVNHAGENGAIHIYAAQAFVARLTAPSLVPELLDFKLHEERHRAIFWAELSERGRPRCRSYWLCALGGMVLGLVTALFGRGAMAATTVAVERVVLRHLHEQISALRDIDTRAVDAIRAVIAEEQHHHDQSASHIQERQGWLRVLQPIVATSTEAVIWLGMKL